MAFGSNPGVRVVIESLEDRRLFHTEFSQALPDQTFNYGDDAVTLDLNQYLNNEAVTGTVVELNTTLGVIQIELFDDATPLTVANFLNYVNSGRYNNTVVHRALNDFVVQAGGYGFDGVDTASFGPFIKADNPNTPANEGLNNVGPLDLPVYEHIDTFAAVANEFSTSPRDGSNKVNTRGTLAMAKVGGDPNSATSEFFFNLTDNSANLDAQNGGFTTFARVLRGMDIVDKIVNPTADGDFSNYYDALDGADPSYPFANMPYRNFEYADGAPTADQVFIISSASVVEPSTTNTFTLSSTNPTVLNPSITGDTLTLTPGGPGTTTITVNVTSVDGHTTTDTFDVTIAPTVTLGPDDFRSVIYNDSDGTKITFSLNTGTAVFGFQGTGIEIVPGTRGSVTVNGTDLSLANINLTETTKRSSLKISATGGADKAANLNDVGVNGTIGSISAPRMNLVGDLFVTGTVGSVSLLSITGGSITVGDEGDDDLALTLKVTDAVVDGSLNATGTVKSITADAWTSSDGQADFISAGDIGTLSIKGDFGATLTTTVGGVKTASVTGNIASASWSIATAIASLKAGSWSNAGGTDALDAGSLGKLSIKANFGPDLTTSAGGITSISVGESVTGGTWNVTGGALTVKAKNTVAGWTGVFSDAIGTITVKETLDGVIAAKSVKTLRAGTFSAPLTLSATDGFALTTFSVNKMTDGEIRSAGDIKTVTVKRGMVNSGIYLAVASDALTVDTAGDFTAPTRKLFSASITNSRGEDAYINSAIVAPVVGKMSLGLLTDAAPSAPFFGIAVDSVDSLRFTLNSNKVAVTKPADQASATQQIQEDGANPQSVVFRVV